MKNDFKCTHLSLLLSCASREVCTECTSILGHENYRWFVWTICTKIQIHSINSRKVLKNKKCSNLTALEWHCLWMVQIWCLQMEAGNQVYAGPLLEKSVEDWTDEIWRLLFTILAEFSKTGYSSVLKIDQMNVLLLKIHFETFILKHWNISTIYIWNYSQNSWLIHVSKEHRPACSQSTVEKVPAGDQRRDSTWGFILRTADAVPRKSDSLNISHKTFFLFVHSPECK